MAIWWRESCLCSAAHAGSEEAGDLTATVPVPATNLEERMSRKLSLATFVLSAMLLAVPVVAQQPDSTKPAATKTMAKAKKRTHTKAKTHKAAKPAAKDSSKK